VWDSIAGVAWGGRPSDRPISPLAGRGRALPAYRFLICATSTHGSAAEISEHSRANILYYFQHLICAVSWQEWQGSNLRPPVLETAGACIRQYRFVILCSLLREIR
jgi:hypothetical protein